jgi:hypothetical protein
MWSHRIDRAGRAPGMRQIGAHKDQVPIVVRAQVISDESMASAVQCECEFEFGVMVPLKRDARG